MQQDAKARLREVEDQIFFIVGSGRSGTSLLQAMVTSHHQAIIPNETKFYTTVVPRLRKRFGDLTGPKEPILDFLLGLWWIKDLELDEQRIRTLALESGATGPEFADTLLIAILAAYAERHDRARVGEKSPGHINHVAKLAARFPNAKFINMLRDPRAVCLSKTRIKTDLRTIIRDVGPHARQWARVMDADARARQTLGEDRYRVVKYEDLVQDPEPVLRSVCEFLALDFDPSMLEQHNRKVQGFGERQRGHMENTLRPVFTSSIEKWKDELSTKEIALIEHVTGERLTAAGYQPTGKRIAAPALHMAISDIKQAIQRLAYQATHRGQHEPE